MFKTIKYFIGQQIYKHYLWKAMGCEEEWNYAQIAGDKKLENYWLARLMKYNKKLEKLKEFEW